jgi:hypothetical protein
MATAPKITDFMMNLSKELVEKKGVAETSANLYMRNLYTLNGKSPFKTLSFLRNKEEVMKKISEYAESTQKTFLASIVSVLSLVADKPTYKNVYRYYYGEMMGKSKDGREKDTSEKTEKQKDNWIAWTEVVDLVNTLRKSILDSFSTKKNLTEGEWDSLLHYVVLSLYTFVQPRRNQDYLDMVVVKKWKEEMPTDKNYLDIAGQQFVFNKYKTAKKYGTQKVAIPDTEETPLFSTLLTYLKHHPLYKTAKGKTPVPFLINSKSEPLTAVNAITRILNKVLGKKVGSSMLRHIFLSDKYDISEMEKDARAMGHSVEEQKKYMKTEGSGVQSVDIPTMLTG